jgi:predicted secreted protein
MNMIPKWSFISGILFLVTPVLFAGSGTDRSGHAAKRLLDESWNGKRIELKVGDEIRIELQGAGATGYAWYIDRLDPHFFQLVREEKREEGNASGDSVGSPTRHTWVIKAKKPGSTVINLGYYRIWEGKDKAIRRFEVEVEVIP